MIISHTIMYYTLFVSFIDKCPLLREMPSIAHQISMNTTRPLCTSQYMGSAGNFKTIILSSVQVTELKRIVLNIFSAIHGYTILFYLVIYFKTCCVYFVTSVYFCIGTCLFYQTANGFTSSYFHS